MRLQRISIIFVACFQKQTVIDLLYVILFDCMVFFTDFNNLNHSPHIDTFWRLCSRWLFKNMVTKEEIAQNKQFILLSPCFQLCSIIGLSFKGSFQLISGIFSKSSAAELLHVGKGLTESGLLCIIFSVWYYHRMLWEM